jgi:hypothetical protein
MAKPELRLPFAQGVAGAVVSFLMVVTGCTGPGQAPSAGGRPAPSGSTSSWAGRRQVPVPDLSTTLQEPAAWMGKQQILFDAPNPSSPRSPPVI